MHRNTTTTTDAEESEMDFTIAMHGIPNRRRRLANHRPPSRPFTHACLRHRGVREVLRPPIHDLLTFATWTPALWEAMPDMDLFVEDVEAFVLGGCWGAGAGSKARQGG
ncbi:hypothetical protein MBLNU230_g6194t1 [Neophaeotheca triangularis]